MKSSTEQIRRNPTYTAEQSAAIAAREFSVALSAGAGCGKTFVLTERFLSHLEPPKNEREEPHAAQPVGGDHLHRTGGPRNARPHPQGVPRAARCIARRKRSSIGGSCSASWIPRGSARSIRSAARSCVRTPSRPGWTRVSACSMRRSPTRCLFELIDRELRRRLADRDEAVIELVVKYGLDRLREMVGLLLGQRQDIDWPAWRDKTPEDLTALWEKFFRETVFPQMLREIIDSPDSRTVLGFCRAEPCPCNHAVMQERMAVIVETLPKISAEQKVPPPCLRTWKFCATPPACKAAARKRTGRTTSFTTNSAMRPRHSASRSTTSRKTPRSMPPRRCRSAEMGMRLLASDRRSRPASTSAKSKTLGVLDFDDLLDPRPAAAWSAPERQADPPPLGRAFAAASGR